MNKNGKITFWIILSLLAFFAVNEKYNGLFFNLHNGCKLVFKIIVICITLLTIFSPDIFYNSDLYVDFRENGGKINILPKTNILLTKRISSSTNCDNYNNSNKKKHKTNNTRSKRKVSEGTKKYVASNQKWKCLKCSETLDCSYEVDHIKPLYKGGTNDVENLQALCRNCHGKKTAKDRILN